MRLAFFGSGDFGCPTLQAFVDGGHEIAAVFTRPDRPAGRGRMPSGTPVKKLARACRLPVYEHVDPNDQKTIDYMRALAVNVAIVVDYGHLISPDLFRIPPEGFINLHASLLPAYRGAAPVPHALLDGAEKTGVTAFRINERFDEGDVLGRVEEAVDPRDTSAELLRRLAPRAARLMMELLGRLEAGWLQAVPQTHGVPSRAPKLRKEDGRVRWRLSAVTLERQVRAFQPWPLAHTVLPTPRGPVRVNLLDVRVRYDEEFVRQRTCAQDTPVGAGRGGVPRVLEATRFCPWDPHCFDGPRPGTITHADPKNGLRIRAGDGSIQIVRMKPEGRSAMSAEAFMRGTPIVQGMCLL